MNFNYSQPTPVIDYQKASDSISGANQFVILLSQRASVDSVASALALYLSLKGNKKKVTIASPNPLTVAFNRLYAVNEVKQSIGNKNMVISFPCKEDSLEKVSYNIENDRFNLVIERKDKFDAIKPSDVRYDYTGIKADVAIIVGAGKIEDTGAFYQEESSFFSRNEVLNISNLMTGVAFGTINVFNPSASSTAELTAELIKKSDLFMDQDIATNLVAGIENSTNNLAYKTSSKTFEVLSWLMEKGGKRGHLGMASQGLPTQVPYNFPSFGASMKQNPSLPFVPQSNPLQSQPYNDQNMQRQVQNYEEVTPTTEPNKENDVADPRPDWFKPKIFKGKTKV